MARLKKSKALYPHPFSKDYWRDAVAELKSLRMLVVAALMIALRLAMKQLYIPLAPNLNINTAFVANALGAMIFGPVMAAICAVITDVLGYLIRPEGVYFVPFILTEVAGSVIFALFLYRAKVTPTRTMLSRFFICFFVNVVLQTPIMLWYYQLYMGGKVYELTIPGILKNLFMFPIESVVLTLFLSVMLPITTRLGLTYGNRDVKETLKFGRKQMILLILLIVLGTGSVIGYLYYHYDTTSISASYTDEQRPVENRRMLDYIAEETEDWKDETVVTVIESAYHPFLNKDTTYTVAVYVVDTDALEAAGGSLDTLWAYSKSKAANDETMTRVATVVQVIDEGSGALLDFTLTPEDGN